MIEVDCRKCKNLSDNECSLYGNDANVAVAKCAENCFANYCEVKKRKTKYKSKKEWEAIFVEELLKDKIEWYATTYERGNYYWCFQLSGCQRYWTNLSKESCRKLGISDSDGVER